MNRRDFLHSISTATASASLAALAFTPTGCQLPTSSPTAVIDTHTHFYDPARPQGVPWPGKNDEILYRTILPPEFQRLTAPHGVVGTVVVEASPWLEDNQWILNLADANPFLVGFVGNIPPGRPEFRAEIRRFSQNRRFRGIRIGGALARESNRRPEIIMDLQRLADLDLSLDVLCGPDDLVDVAKLARQIPKLRIIINHCANVRIDGQTPPAPWSHAIQECGALPNLHMKVSGLVEGSGRADGAAPGHVEFYQPVLDAIWAAFGENRVLYGSNWPVSVRFAPYPRVQKIVADYFEQKGPLARNKYFLENSRRFYRWVDPTA